MIYSSVVAKCHIAEQKSFDLIGYISDMHGDIQYS